MQDLDDDLWRFVDAAGTWVSTSYGMPRMAGRVLGWLLVCEPIEQTAAQIAEALGASAGSISGATGTLVRAHIVDRLHIRGERADRFRVRPEAWDEQVRDQGIDQARALIALGLQALAEAPAARRARLEELDAFYAWWDARMPALWDEWQEYKRTKLEVDVGADTASAIEVRGLGMTFGAVTALDGLDLTVARGTVFGLLGPNGAGKTTVVRVLATLLRPTRGSAKVLDHDVVGDAIGVRRRIGLAGQSAAVDGELTGRENLEMIGRLYRLSAHEARRRASEVLERFALTGAADRRVSTYSGGMRRRLDLGASLAGRPPVLLLDEPTAGLDPRSRLELWTAVDELRREGTTVLLTTQYLDEADRLAQRIAVIDRGHLVAEGTASELKGTIGTEVLAVRMADPGCARDAAGVLAPLSTGDPPSADLTTGEVRLPVTGSEASAAAVRSLDQRGWGIAAIELRRPSLDDVFLSLTGRPTGEDPGKPRSLPEAA